MQAGIRLAGPKADRRTRLIARALPLAALFAPVGVLANDSVAEMGAGGLVLRHSRSVEMRSEDLFLSAERIRVRYVFRNPGARAVRTIVAFPMPAEDLARSREQDLSFPEDFRTLVDGRPVRMAVERRAWRNGADRSALLARMHVPLAEDASGRQAAALTGLNPADRRLLLQQQLVEQDAGERRPSLLPLWSVRETWFWTQLFPAGASVVIEHSYRPGVGGTAGVPLTSRAYRDSPGGRLDRAEFCVDDRFLAGLDRLASASNRSLVEQRIRYILTTGSNWRAPIGSFRLVVDKGRPDAIVSLCGRNLRQISPTRFELRRTNWRPDRDLAVLIVAPVRQE